MSSLFSFIKQQVPIVQEIGRYVRLRHAGAYLKGPCPFHKETDASFTVSPDKGIFYCFGCHATGDVVSFVAKAENMTPIEAAKQLIEAHGLKIPDDLLKSASSQLRQAEGKASYFAIHKLVAQWAHEQLRLHAHAYEYVKARGITDALIDSFMIGFFPSGPRPINALLALALKEQVLAKDLIESGIFYEATKTQLHSPFEDRIVFPITDSMGRFCGFGGRIFVSHDERAKYYNSKESPFFLKGSLLFGYSAAKRSIQERKAVFLVEGYTDCVMMAQYGYTNVVATLGTACTKEHLQLLARSAEVVYVIYDGDAAGRKAMLRVAQLCWQVNLELRVIVLPRGLDPAAYLHEAQSLSDVLPAARDIFTFFVSATAEQFSQKNLAEKMRTIDEVIDVISKISDVVKREVLLQQLSCSIDIPITALRLKLQEWVQATPEQAGAKEVVVADTAAVDALDVQLVAICAQSVLHPVVHTLPPEAVGLLSVRAQRVYGVLQDCVRRDEGVAIIDALLAAVTPHDAEWLVPALTVHGLPVGEQEFAALVNRLLMQRWKEMAGRIRQDIAEASARGDEMKVDELLGSFAQLKEHLQNKGHIYGKKGS